MKEPANFLFEIDGEVVINVKPNIGYNHRGMERAFETKTFLQNVYLAERICGICSDAHTTCYTQAVEELLNVEIPERANYIRVLIAELERIHSHLLWVGIAAHEIGFDTLFMYIWRDRETVLDTFEKISGNRVHYAMNTIGGVRRDLSETLSTKIQRGMDSLEKRIAYYLNLAKEDETILKRTSGVGILKPEDALNLCTVGPNLRASGVELDVRKADPYASYDEISFEVITHNGCDVLSRILVRCKEMLESIKIIRHSLANIPKGPINTKVPMKVPAGEAVSRVEAPRGELIHYVRSNGTAKPERIKVRSPTLANVPGLCKMLVGGYVADIPIVLAGIDPCFSCTDRLVFIDVRNGVSRFLTKQQLRGKSGRT